MGRTSGAPHDSRFPSDAPANGRKHGVIGHGIDQCFARDDCQTDTMTPALHADVEMEKLKA